MTHEQLMERHKVRSKLSDLTEQEREIYDAFLELGETEVDRRILIRVWLKHHREQVMAWAK